MTTVEETFQDVFGEQIYNYFELINEQVSLYFFVTVFLNVLY
jgi:hypothetical protein